MVGINRTRRFTESERKILTTIIKHPKVNVFGIIHSYDFSAAGRHAKKLAWDKVSRLFDANVKHSEKSVEQLRSLWKRLKAKSVKRRKELAMAIVESKKIKTVDKVDERATGEHQSSSKENLYSKTGNEDSMRIKTLRLLQPTVTNNDVPPQSSVTATDLKKFDAAASGLPSKTSNCVVQTNVATKNIANAVTNFSAKSCHTTDVLFRFSRMAAGLTHDGSATNTNVLVNSKTSDLPLSRSSTFNLHQAEATSVISTLPQNLISSRVSARTTLATIKLPEVSRTCICPPDILGSADLVNPTSTLQLLDTNTNPPSKAANNRKLPTNTVASRPAQGSRKNRCVTKTISAISTSVVGCLLQFSKLTNTIANTSSGSNNVTLTKAANNNKLLASGAGTKRLEQAAMKEIDMLETRAAAHDSFSGSSEFDVTESDSDSSEDDLPLGATAATVVSRAAVAEKLSSLDSLAAKCDILNEALLSYGTFPRTSTPELSPKERLLFLQDTDDLDDRILACSSTAVPEVFEIQKELLAKTISFRKQQKLLDQEIYKLKKRKITLEMQFLTDKFELERQMIAKRSKI